MDKFPIDPLFFYLSYLLYRDLRMFKTTITDNRSKKVCFVLFSWKPTSYLCSCKQEHGDKENVPKIFLQGVMY